MGTTNIDATKRPTAGSPKKDVDVAKRRTYSNGGGYGGPRPVGGGGFGKSKK